MIYDKDPAAVKDYGLNWTAWMSSGDTISTSVWSGDIAANSSTLLVTSSSISSHTTICFVGSGTAGGVHRVSNRIVTAQGRTEERSLDMRIINL